MDDKEAGRILNILKIKRSAFWKKEQERRTLALFHRAARGIPAYKDFLKKNRIVPGAIKTFANLQKVPLTNKKNYLRQYPLERLLWNGTFKSGATVWTSTSGSTGEPFYFPRTETLDAQYSVIAETFLQNSSYGDGPTLVIVGFGMGVWIGGLITYKAFEIAGKRLGQHISILTPGINKQEIFNAFTSLAPHFKQTILIGYPPFVKDVLEEAAARGINIKKMNLRLFFAAEAFTETFRRHVAELAGIKDLCRDTLNIYGSADLGAMAFESPFSIFTRQRASADTRLFSDLFSEIEMTPTLAQYNPLFINFEAVNGEIALTGDNTIPLIRYAIGDHGGVFSADQVRRTLALHAIDIKKEERAIKADFSDLPFVYIFERSDFSTKLYGAIIYPEHIKEGLEHRSLQRSVTGRFTMATKFDDSHDEYLEVNVETRPRVRQTATLKRQVSSSIVRSLMEHNAEYHNNYNSMPRKVTPRIVFWEYEHPVYFKPGIKQKWVVKK
ncbi:MAG TPA: hypothetical protein VMA75_02735 [Candidatus Paceibacterota bacterium]|nr:hypothetical protein [Candidatus Paceibacterota bacterium]